MKFYRYMLFSPLLLLLILAGGCGVEEPVAFLSFRPFHTGLNSDEIGFYIDWQNTSKDKSIDSLVLSMYDSSDPEQSFLVRLLELEDVTPQGHNNQKITVLPRENLPSMEFGTLCVSLHQVNFSDGSSWEAKGTTVLSAEVDGQTGSGAFPVELKQALFYEESANPFQVSPMNFQIDWTNHLKTDSIIGVVYQITARTAEGTVIPNAEGNDVTYVSRFYKEASQWTAPCAKNVIVEEAISAFSAASAFRQGGAVRFEISVCRAIDSSGTVWENSTETPPIETVLLGKKGYSFLLEAPNASVAALVERISQESSRCGIELGEPAIFMEDGSFCVLRYEDVDVRVELSDDNEVLPDAAALMYYSVKQFDHFEVYVQSVINQMVLLRRCICTAVLTDLSASSLAQALDAYALGNYLETSYGQIDIDGSFYGTFEMLANILDEHSNIVLCDEFAIGKELNDRIEFLWIRESPYSGQKS